MFLDVKHNTMESPEASSRWLGPSYVRWFQVTFTSSYYCVQSKVQFGMICFFLSSLQLAYNFMIPYSSNERTLNCYCYSWRVRFHSTLYTHRNHLASFFVTKYAFVRYLHKMRKFDIQWRWFVGISFRMFQLRCQATYLKKCGLGFVRNRFRVFWEVTTCSQLDGYQQWEELAVST